MADTVFMGAKVKPETVERIAKIGVATYRGKGAVIDWLVDEAWRKINETGVIEVPSRDDAASKSVRLSWVHEDTKTAATQS